MAFQGPYDFLIGSLTLGLAVFPCTVAALFSELFPKRCWQLSLQCGV